MVSIRFATVASLATIATLTSAQWAQHGVWVPGFQEPMPKYWTGTLNLARGSAISEGGWIDEAWLYIRKGPDDPWIEVNHWLDDPDPGGPMGKSLEVAFDSTNFDDGDYVFVKFVVNDIRWGFSPLIKESAPGVAQVHNKAYAYEHHDSIGIQDSHGGLQAWFAFMYMNYAPYSRFATGWTDVTIKSDSYDMVLVYFNTHGLSDAVYEDDNTLFYGSDVEAWRMLINGSGYPPFNSTGNPPTQYVHLDTCDSGTHGSFSKWFWPGIDAYFGGTLQFPVNKAHFGYSGGTYWNDRIKMADRYWPPLKDRKTVYEMRELLIEYCHDYAANNDDNIYIKFYPGGPTYRALWYPSDCPVWGDWYTRLSGVYTGNTTLPPTIWYRPV